MTTQFNCRLSDPTRQMLRALALRDDITETAVIAMLINRAHRAAFESVLPIPTEETRPQKANASWSSQEDQQLAARYSAGMTTAHLAEEFKRSPGAITSRLAKLHDRRLIP